MASEIKIIAAMANCYLVSASGGNFVLIDTGVSYFRPTVERALLSAGCRPGNLNLIILTHGDMDHSGNGAYLRRKFGTQIAMHQDDAGMVENGDMSWNRKTSQAIRFMFNLPLVRLSKSNRFTPDIYLADGQDLSNHGWPGTKVFNLPGHSKGSLCLLTSQGELFCGDLLINNSIPSLNSIIDDRAAATASLKRLKGMSIETVYPGHGRPFRFAQLA